MSNNILNLRDNIVVTDDMLIIKENTSEAIKYLTRQKERLKILRDIHASNNFNDILNAEKLLIATELVISNEQEQSIKNALKEFDSGQKALTIVKDKEGYKKAYLTYPDKAIDGQGLPKDAFRIFIGSQQTRLSNKLKNPGSEIQAEILKQRKANMLLANNMYREMQKEALDTGMSGDGMNF